ncbi:MAG: hypothetical protein WDZ85_03480 [Candidatus Paceibacterota bacterium]
MSGIRVGVLRGGPSSRYGSSLATGASILKHLPTEFRPVDVLVDRRGNWHLNGLSASPESIKRSLDVAINALHGDFGQDGGVQQILEALGLPYTGPRPVSAALAANKQLTKTLLEREGIKMPTGLHFSAIGQVEEEADEVFKRLSPPWIIKPANRAALKPLLAYDFPALEQALQAYRHHYQPILVEEYIVGRRALGGVLNHFRNRRHYSLPVAEVPLGVERSPDGKYFILNLSAPMICPGLFNDSVKEEIADLAIRAHQSLGLAHYSASDFVVSPRGIYFLGTDTLPALTEDAFWPQAFQAVGGNLRQFIGHLIDLTLSAGHQNQTISENRYF